MMIDDINRFKVAVMHSNCLLHQ